MVRPGLPTKQQRRKGRCANALAPRRRRRDLAQVVASYRRLGWASWLSGRYVDDHLRWQVGRGGGGR